MMKIKKFASFMLFLAMLVVLLVSKAVSNKKA